MAKGVLALLGSGETAPGMTKVHRSLFKKLGDVRAVNLDTSYGFQENVPQMTEKLTSYFETSLHVIVEPLHFASLEGSSPLERTIFKQRVRDANYVFSGPGSPSYALEQWRPIDLGSDLAYVLDNGGTLCFASAAVLTLGAFTAPIYEIYKAGSALYWLEGLNVLAPQGLNCVMIPHFDNREGGNYDTSRCYLGERRLALLEEKLPDGVATLGIDEHSALIFDFARDTLQVLGKSHGYWRLNGDTKVLVNGTTLALDELRSPSAPHGQLTARPVVAPLADEPTELGHLVAGGGAQALEALARLVRLAAKGGGGYVDPAPLVEGVLAARDSARSSGQYELADQLRHALVKAGIDVQDGPDGSTWSLAASY